MAQDSPSGPEIAGRSRTLWLVWLGFAALAIALAFTTFGNPIRNADETFYLLVGQRMHEGALPYVDIWDRKPIGLFLAYYLIAGLGNSVLPYQVIACLLAATTGLLVCRIVAQWSGRAAGICAGLCYIFIIGPLEGNSGQTPDFYNPLIAGAALCVASELKGLVAGRIGWRVWLAMLLCGMALTFKQTVVFEACFFGLSVLYALWRGGASTGQLVRTALGCAALGLLPTLLIAGYYWQVGHFAEYWHAMVTSNLAKARSTGEARRSLGIFLRALPLILVAVWALMHEIKERGLRAFIAGWLIAALIGFVSVPNFFSHYALPVIVPLSVAAGFRFAHPPYRNVIVLGTALWAMTWHSPDQREWTRDSVRTTEVLARMVREHDGGGGLLVFDGPHELYSITRKPPLSPLVFTHHLNHQTEHNVSHLDTDREIDRILSKRPGVVVMVRYPLNRPVNRYARLAVLGYVRGNCRLIGVVKLQVYRNRLPMVVFGDCRAAEKP